MNNIREVVNRIEAVLFASGEAVDLEFICEICEINESDLQKIYLLLKDRYEDTGLKIVLLASKCQILTREEYGLIVAKAVSKQKNTPLSSAALEVLATVAYNEPVTRSFIEQVRGVDSSGVLSTLVERELVKEVGRLDLPGRPIAYATTPVFLRSFKLESLADLPDIPYDED